MPLSFYNYITVNQIDLKKHLLNGNLLAQEKSFNAPLSFTPTSMRRKHKNIPMWLEQTQQNKMFF